MSIQTCDYTVKVIFIGDTNTGKTSVLHKIQNPGQNAISVERTSTIGVEFGAFVKNFDNKIIKYNIWDTAGQEKFRSITTSFYKNAAIAIVFCDLSNYSTYRSLRGWLHDVRQHAPETVSILLVANKSDLDNNRKIFPEDLQYISNQYGVQYIEVSAKSGAGINNILNITTTNILQKHKSGEKVSGLTVKTEHMVEIKTGSKLCDKCTIM